MLTLLMAKRPCHTLTRGIIIITSRSVERNTHNYVNGRCKSVRLLPSERSGGFLYPFFGIGSENDDI